MFFFRRRQNGLTPQAEPVVSQPAGAGSRRRGKKRHRGVNYRRLSLENLEDRQLLAVVTLNPVKDNTLVENASGSKSNGVGDVFVGLNADQDRIRRGLVHFNVAGSVPAGATINSVTLTMWANRTQVGNGTIELHKVLSDWGQAGSSGRGSGGNAQIGDATWLHTFYSNQFWATPGGDFSPTVSGSQTIGSSGASYTWNSTGQMVADVQSWLDDPSANFGWLLQGDESQRSSKRFDSSESSNASRRPTLTIDYTEAAPIPDISIGDVTLVEGDAGTASAQFDVSLSAPSTQSVTLGYATANGTAVAGADYQATSGSLTFSPGQTVKTITVPVTGDRTVELSESFQVNLSNAQNGTIVDAQGLGTISNDDNAALSIGDVTLSEGHSGTTNFDFTVTLSAAVDNSLSVQFTTADDTATTADLDYTAASGTLSFSGTAGETKTVTIAVTGDRKFETDEVFLINLAGLSAAGRNVTIADGQGRGVITNDDTTTLPSISISDVTIAEGNAGSVAAQFDVTLSEPSAATVTVNFATADISATAGADYQATGGTLTFSPGQTSARVSVAVTGDAVVETDESFLVNLSSAHNAVLLDSQGAGTISNDDAASFSIGDVTQAEGDVGVTRFDFTVTLSADVDVPVSVDFSTADGAATSADSDFAAATGTLRFTGSAGETQTVSVNVSGDRAAEFDENFFVNLTGVTSGGRNVTIADGRGLGTINNDDATLTAVTIRPVKDNTLIENAVGAVSNGAGALYVGQNANGNLVRRGLLAFDLVGSVPAGATIQSVALTMYVSATQVGDVPVEIHKVLADWGEAASSGKGTGAPAQPGDATWLHTSFDNTFWSSVGGDFSPVASTMQTVGPTNASYTWGSTPQLVSDAQSWLDDPNTNFGWLLKGDETQNSSKQFESRESGDRAFWPSLTIGYTESPPPKISISDATVTESDSGTTTTHFDITLSAPSNDTVTVDFSTADGTALAGSDYQAAAGTISFAPNQTIQTLQIHVNGDTDMEADEMFFVYLSNATGAGIADNQGQATILNDDDAGSPTLTISNVTRQEGDEGTTDFVFRVRLDSAADEPVSVDFTTADGTAVAVSTNGGGNDEGDDEDDHDRDDDDRDDDDRDDDDRGNAEGDSGEREAGSSDSEPGDYTATSGTLHFVGNAGETLTITVSVQGDRRVEQDENFFVNLSNAVGAEIAAGQGVGVITNDDDAGGGHERRWQNPRDQFDVSGEGEITALDALLVLNYINSHLDDASLPVDLEWKPPYFDVSGDDYCTAQDVLMVINRLNRRPANGGEGELVAPTSTSMVPLAGPITDTGQKGYGGCPHGDKAMQENQREAVRRQDGANWKSAEKWDSIDDTDSLDQSNPSDDSTQVQLWDREFETGEFEDFLSVSAQYKNDG